MWWRGYPFRSTLHNTIFSDEFSQKRVRTVGTTAGVRDDGCSSRGGQSEYSGESVLWLFPTGFKGGGLVYPSGGMRSSASSPCYVLENGEGNGFVVVSGDDRGAWCRWSGYSGGGFARRSTLYGENK